MLIAALFGAWPVVLVAALVLIVALFVYYFDEIVNFFSIWVLKLSLVWLKFTNWLTMKWFDGLIWMAQQADNFINRIISMLNKLPMFNIGFTSNAAGILQEAKAGAFAMGLSAEALIKRDIQDRETGPIENDSLEEQKNTNSILERILEAVSGPGGVPGSSLDFSNSTGA